MSSYLSFIFTSFILALTPGPDVLLVLAIAAKEGFPKALQLTLGLATGVIFHTALILLGFSALIIASPLAMNLIAIFGAGYLLYLAWLTWLHRSDSLEQSETPKIQGSYYLRGVIMNISNPKVLLFFLAFFPQFANLDHAGYAQRLILLGAAFIGVTLVVFSSIAWIGAKGSEQFFRNPSYQLAINWLTIFVFLLVAMVLLFA